jgi:hypothetical protein
MQTTEVLYKSVPKYNTPWQLLVTSPERVRLRKFYTEDEVLGYTYSICRNENTAREIVRQAKLYGRVHLEVSSAWLVPPLLHESTRL